MTLEFPPDAPERCESSFTELVGMLRPVAERAIVRKIRDERERMYLFEEQATRYEQQIRHGLLSNGMDRADADRFMREVRRRLVNEELPTRDDDPAIDDEVVRTLHLLTLAWVTLLLHAAEGEPPDATIDLSAIGVDMLPQSMHASHPESLDEALSHTVVTPDEFRRFLTFVRGAGQWQGPLPEAMLVFLTLNGVNVENR